MNYKFVFIVFGLLAATLVVSSAPAGDKTPQDDDELSNKLLPFIPLKGATFYSTADEQLRNDKSSNNMIPGYSFELERESPNSEASVEKPQKEQKTVGPTAQKAKSFEQVKDIAYNSREVLLVGPDQKEVEVKDNVAAKMAVALENLKQEASDVWGVVNEKLDQGWTELGKGLTELNKELDKGWTGFKSMVEGAVSKQNGNKKTSQ